MFPVNRYIFNRCLLLGALLIGAMGNGRLDPMALEGLSNLLTTIAFIPNHLLRNVGTGYFEDVSASAGKDFQSPALFHGAAFADFDNDGRVDVVVSRRER